MDVFSNASLSLADQLPLLLAGSIKALVVLALTALVAFALRKRGAAIRHWVWSLGLAGALLIPVLTAVVPTWNVPVLPLSTQQEMQATTMEQPIPEMSPQAAEGAVMSARPTESIAEPPEEADAASPAAVAEEAEAPAAASAVLEASAAASEKSGLDWAAWLLALWLGGALLVSLYFAVGSLCARWLTRRGRDVQDPVWIGMLRDVRAELGIDRSVRLVWSDRAAMPFTWGITRPCIVLPTTATGWPHERRRIVLLHEAAHIKRWDCLTQAIGQLTCVLHWFNPLVWWAARQLRIERERATDDYVLAIGTRPSTYAEHLLDMARSLGTAHGAPFGAVSMAKPSQLEGRLLSILRNNNGRRTLTRMGATFTALGFFVLLLPLAAMHPVPSDLSGTPGPVPVGEYVTIESSDVKPPASTMAATESFDTEPPASEPARSGAVQDTPIERTFRVQEGGQLHLETNSGSINIRTGDRDRVHVEIHISGENAAEVDWFDVDFEQRDNDVYVTGEVENRQERFSWLRGRSGPNVRYVVTVPPRYNLDLNTAGGSIEVSDLEGTVAVRTSGGSLRIGQIDGPIDAETSGGSITIDGATADVRAHTAGGSINLGPVQGEVDAHTSGGSINVNGVAGTVRARTSGGSVTARITEQPQGDSELRTSGGSITIYLAEGIGLNVDAQTSVGRVVTDVSVEGDRTSQSSFRGTVGGGGPQLVARTAAGNISIRPLTASTDAGAELGGFHYEFGDEHFDFRMDWSDELRLEIEEALEEAMREVEHELERATAEIEREVEYAMADLDVGAIASVAHDSATTALLQALRDLDAEIPEGWAKQGIAAAAAGLLEKKAYEQPTLTVTHNGETEEVQIVTLLAELPGGAGHPALSRLAENHPDPKVRRQARNLLP